MTYVLFSAKRSFQPYGYLFTSDKAKFDSTLANKCTEFSSIKAKTIELITLTHYLVTCPVSV
jgi:hypothetical protein